MEGFLLVDKSVWASSHRVTHTIRKFTGIQRVGHAGTLDPFATGLLVVGIGRAATKHLSRFLALSKTYETTFVLGATTPTDDSTKEPILCSPSVVLTQKSVQEALKTFQGAIEQIPPQYSAIKLQGQPMYQAACKGMRLEAKPRSVHIFSLTKTSPLAQKENGTWEISLSIHCSSGTYIRSLARDLGKALGTGGYVKNLRRTSIGPFFVKDALPFENISLEEINARLIPIEQMLQKLQ
jgi:tRNA pseudouridine55 synthase